MRHISPQQPENRWPATSYVGEVVPFEATVFREGHGLIRVELILTAPDGAEETHRLLPTAPGTDRWHTLVRVDQQGAWRFRIRAAADDWQSWVHDAELTVVGGPDPDLVLAMGAALLATISKKLPAAARRAIENVRTTLLDTSVTPETRLAAAHDTQLAAILDANPITSLETESEEQLLIVHRTRAAVGSWYEFFPRSEGAKKRRDGSWTSGTFRTAAKSLPRVAAMGFDTVYLPPIHPIGVAHRKGPNNSPTAGPSDPGSPWAIGSAEGGHDAIHPELGTLRDFTYFRKQAESLGLEVALDLALQCSPDHPWVAEHPEWFTERPDGSIAYAENPPKRYQDIYPLNFDRDPEGIRAEILRIVELWIARGVTIFRVDNPHTKPLGFWEWLLAEVADRHPDVVFLAEAFTRPALLHALAAVGFHQSYSYFTWRNTKRELEEFFTDITGPSADYLRPNLFVNTPDILTEYLQTGGTAAYKVRAALAATASPLWGVYAGYELFENVARPGSEENIDNEKYQYVRRDWAKLDAAGTTLTPYLTLLNSIRAAHPALGQLRNLRLHSSDDDAILVFSKHLDGQFTPDGRSDTIIVVANVDPHGTHETLVHLDLDALGVRGPFAVRDLVTGSRWTWTASNYVRLAPAEPVHILAIEGR
ncbi:MAG TPA: maltotransferase domain-containing protein [Pseudolysinimonas sp.]|nr:maltotransferase domain-containing protein [Pseudolysinimonas sp.]